MDREKVVRLLVASRMMLELLEDDAYAASLVSVGFPAELRSMISATERHLDAITSNGA